MAVKPIREDDLTPAVLERFWAKTQLEGDCLVWTGALAPNGYGKFSRGFAPDARRYNAHRFAYVATHGQTDLELDHLCRNRACVNPDHLEPVTRMENVRRAMSPTCPQGHPYTADNTILERGRPGQNPSRRCRTCRRERQSRKAA